MRCYIQIYRRISMEESLHTVLTLDDTGRTKTCVMVAVVYTVFWTPFVLVQFYGIFGRYTEVVFNLHALSSIFGVMASAVSPYLYCTRDPYYKRRLAETFGYSRSCAQQWNWIRNIVYLDVRNDVFYQCALNLFFGRRISFNKPITFRLGELYL